jgi:phage baseplate assembly protein W
MSGMNRQTGKAMISDKEHMLQSLDDILLTPKGSRVMNREYGSDLFNLIDHPINNKIDIYSAIAEAIDLWEPRFRLKEVSFEQSSEGVLAITIGGDYLPTQERVLKRLRVG